VETRFLPVTSEDLNHYPAIVFDLEDRTTGPDRSAFMMTPG